MPAPPAYLLDTCILVHLARRSALGKAVEARYQLLGQPFKPLISVVTVGEALKLARGFGWGEGKTAMLTHLLDQFTCIELGDPTILAAYAEIAYFSEKSGKRKEQNDYWIAATAAATKALLLTTDTDFDHLHPRYLQRDFIAAESFGQP